MCEEPLMGVCFVIENIIIDYGSQGEGEMVKQKVENDGNLDGKGGKPTCPTGEPEEIQNPGKSIKAGGMRVRLPHAVQFYI